MSVPNLFELPTAPEQFSVLLPPAELRKLDFSALEFQTARKAVIEYIKTYYPDDFNDFVSNNGIIMLVELLSYLTALLSLRSDILANEAFLPTARTENAVINHLALINQSLKPATAATADIECSVSSPLSSDIAIQPGLTFEVAGDDGSPIYYEVFSAPDDLTSNIVVPAGKRGIIAYGLEGKTTTFVATSSGAASQGISILDRNILNDNIRVYISIGGVREEWVRTAMLESAGASDKVFEARILQNELRILFGDNINGAIPKNGSTVTVSYRTGGGIRGRIGAGIIDDQRSITPEYPYTAPVLVRFRNIAASTGGSDRESTEAAKKRGPRDFATHGAAVTASDYVQLATSFSHPTFGTASKAMAAVRTGINANIVDVYVLAQGPNNTPVVPSQGLKNALSTYLDDINVLTDTARVQAGSIHPVDIQATIVMNRNADATIVRTAVEDAITRFFDISLWDMGQPFYLARLYETLNKIDGVSYVDIFQPADNILPTGGLYDDSSPQRGVAINEVLTLGNREIKYYYEA